MVEGRPTAEGAKETPEEPHVESPDQRLESEPKNLETDEKLLGTTPSKLYEQASIEMEAQKTHPKTNESVADDLKKGFLDLAKGAEELWSKFRHGKQENQDKKPDELDAPKKDENQTAKPESSSFFLPGQKIQATSTENGAGAEESKARVEGKVEAGAGLGVSASAGVEYHPEQTSKAASSGVIEGQSFLPVRSSERSASNDSSDKQPTNYEQIQPKVVKTISISGPAPGYTGPSTFQPVPKNDSGKEPNIVILKTHAVDPEVALSKTHERKDSGNSAYIAGPCELPGVKTNLSTNDSSQSRSGDSSAKTSLTPYTIADIQSALKQNPNSRYEEASKQMVDDPYYSKGLRAEAQGQAGVSSYSSAYGSFKQGEANIQTSKNAESSGHASFKSSMFDPTPLAYQEGKMTSPAFKGDEAMSRNITRMLDPTPFSEHPGGFQKVPSDAPGGGYHSEKGSFEKGQPGYEKVSVNDFRADGSKFTLNDINDAVKGNNPGISPGIREMASEGKYGNEAKFSNAASGLIDGNYQIKGLPDGSGKGSSAPGFDGPPGTVNRSPIGNGSDGTSTGSGGKIGDTLKHESNGSLLENNNPGNSGKSSGESFSGGINKSSDSSYNISSNKEQSQFSNHTESSYQAKELQAPLQKFAEISTNNNNLHGSGKAETAETNTRQVAAALPQVSEQASQTLKQSYADAGVSLTLARATTQTGSVVSLDALSSGAKAQDGILGVGSLKVNPISGHAQIEITGPAALSSIQGRNTFSAAEAIQSALATKASSSAEASALSASNIGNTSLQARNLAQTDIIPPSLSNTLTSGKGIFDASAVAKLGQSADAAARFGQSDANSGTARINPGSLNAANLNPGMAQIPGTQIQGARNPGAIGPNNFQPAQIGQPGQPGQALQANDLIGAANPVRAGRIDQAGTRVDGQVAIRNADLINSRIDPVTGKIIALGPIADGKASFDPLAMSRINKALSGEKRYLTGVEIALAVAMASAAVARRRGDQSDGEIASEDLKALLEDFDSEDLQSRIYNTGRNNADRQFKRETYVVSHNDTLQDIAEKFFNNTDVAWLIADINAGRLSEHTDDGKRIVELRSRQEIELPHQSEVNEFLFAKKKEAKAEHMVTIVVETEIDRELLDSFLSTVVGVGGEESQTEPIKDAIPVPQAIASGKQPLMQLVNFGMKLSQNLMPSMSALMNQGLNLKTYISKIDLMPHASSRGLEPEPQR